MEFSAFWGGGTRYLEVNASSLAFTLAEVLVTLGIIGVVSALTLPALVKNHQRQVYVIQLHKVYNEVQQAVDSYVTENNYVNLGESRIRNNADELRRFVNKYFKVTQNCGTHYTPCFEAEYSSLNGDTVSDIGSLCNIVVTIADGTAICWDVAPMDAEVDEDGNSFSSSNSVGSDGEVIDLEVDINGKQGPNIYGRDMFAFVVGRDGMIYDPAYVENGNSANLNYKWVSNGTFGKIMNEGWKMNY